MNPYDNIKIWEKSTAYQPPADTDILSVQKDIDAICGLGRNNISTVKLVWSGDVNYWYETYTAWDKDYQPTKVIKRPLINYGSILDKHTGQVERDVLPPRWLLLQPYEPEQFADSWEKDSYKTTEAISHFDGDNKPVMHTQQYLWRPPTPPKIWYDVMRHIGIIAEHKNGCCKEGEVCYGYYKDARSCLSMLEAIKKQMMADDFKGVSPFASPKEVNQIARPFYTAYDEQVEQLMTFRKRALEAPMSILSIETMRELGSMEKIKETVLEILKMKEDKGITV